MHVRVVLVVCHVKRIGTKTRIGIGTGSGRGRLKMVLWHVKWRIGIGTRIWIVSTRIAWIDTRIGTRIGTGRWRLDKHVVKWTDTSLRIGTRICSTIDGGGRWRL